VNLSFFVKSKYDRAFAVRLSSPRSRKSCCASTTSDHQHQPLAPPTAAASASGRSGGGRSSGFKSCQILTADHVSAPTRLPTQHPQTPPLESCQTEHGSSRGAVAAAGPKQTGTALQRTAAEAPAAGSPGPQVAPARQAGLGGCFGPRLQPDGARKALGVRLGRGDEQGGRGAARAAGWRLTA
jgi:hypothetical protein